MPMLSDPDRRFNETARPPAKPPTPPLLLQSRDSDESIRTEFCEGPIPEDLPFDPRSSVSQISIAERRRPISSRQDLIERIKRGESPTWVPKEKHNGLFEWSGDCQTEIGARGSQNGRLLPAFEPQRDSSRPEVADVDPAAEGNAQAGLEIERPRSALHAGDFTKSEHSSHDFPNAFHADLDRIARSEKAVPSDTSSTPWYKPLPLEHPGTAFTPNLPFIDIPDSSNRRSTRSRAPSLQSYSSSFVLKPPTSPLVHQSNNDDLDFSPIDLSSSPSKANRRHTLPPHTFQSLRTQPPNLAQAARQPPSLQRENSLPFQSHQPRRSLTSISPFGASPSPQRPIFLRSRRPSFASDASPIQHASMVGSYEESILRGRMSTTPSKPLDFTAQIGALGKGNCKPKYPAHVSLEFPAVYYSWSSHLGSSLDEPSPYVGLIDLEHKLPAPTPREKRKRRERQRLEDLGGLSEASNGSQRESRRKEKRRRRTPSPSGFLTGGCYRIPQQGQLQILIKNPYKTAVKLFLVPYDLDGMEAGTKTFVRQRCYSAGPIIEKPLTSRSESSLETRSVSADSKSKPTLRYLIQLNICCPSRGRYYLYKNIHVVFANRVPDDKERLQNEILWPEPRYSPWKPAGSESTTPLTEKIMRSRSYGDHKPAAQYDVMDGLSFGGSRNDIETFSPMPMTPFQLSRTDLEENEADPSPRQKVMQPADKGLNLESNEVSQGLANISNTYAKLNRGEAGYGGIFGRPGTPEPGKGLLARRLRGLDVIKNKHNDTP